nr:hypothetical protein [Planctomycetales bacterium]
MKQSFRGLPRMARACLLVAAGWPAAAAGQIPAVPSAVSAESSGSSASGDVLVDSAIRALDRFHSISARVRLQARFFDHQLFGSGRYLQRGRGDERQVRWELSIPTSRTKNVMISVSNGRQWWRYVETAEK